VGEGASISAGAVVSDVARFPFSDMSYLLQTLFFKRFVFSFEELLLSFCNENTRPLEGRCLSCKFGWSFFLQRKYLASKVRAKAKKEEIAVGRNICS
jgi:hypothetical protein